MIKSVREAIEVLRKCLSGNTFAVSLVSQYDRKGISPKQEFWVLKLANDLVHPVVVAISLMPIVDLFKAALSNLKRPKLTFVWKGTSFRLSVSKCGNWIYVSEPVYQGWYYGKISMADGAFTKGRDANQVVVDFLTDFATDPVAKSAEYGKLTGNCCFCAKHLDRAESLEVGYGPICAKKWNLPHTYRNSPKGKGEAIKSIAIANGIDVIDFKAGEVNPIDVVGLPCF